MDKNINKIANNKMDKKYKYKDKWIKIKIKQLIIKMKQA